MPLLLWLCRSNIQTFLEDADEKRLLIFIDGKGDYMASKDPPDAYKKNTKVRPAAAAAVPPRRSPVQP